MGETSILVSTAHAQQEKMTIAEIMSRAIVFSGDRRSTRDSRLRAAVEAGLAPASALKIRQCPAENFSDRRDGNESSFR
jgi:hypothetical protein